MDKEQLKEAQGLLKDLDETTSKCEDVLVLNNAKEYHFTIYSQFEEGSTPYVAIYDKDLAKEVYETTRNFYLNKVRDITERVENSKIIIAK